MPIVEARYEVPPDRTGRLDRIVQELTGRSRAEVRGLFDRDCVTHNGTLNHDPGLMVQAGDVIVVRHDPHTRYHPVPRTRNHSDLRIVYEDDDLLVVDKPPLILTVPSDRHEQHTLQSVIDHYLHRLQLTAGVVHRLDWGTSGLLVFSKRRAALQHLREQFREHAPDRQYVAIVVGCVPEDSGTFESRLQTTKSLQRYSAPVDEERGEIAITHYQVEQRFRNATLVRAHLETGRRNQIRVHFSEAGHPVLGDDRYSPKLAWHPSWKAGRLALHAQTLGFVHPRTGQPLQFTSPLPEEFTRFLARAE